MNPQALQVRYVCDSVDQFRKRGIDQRERIAATKNNFVQALVGRNLIERRLPFCDRAWGFSVRKMSSKTVTTMHGTRACCDEQYASVVLLKKTRLPFGQIVADRVDRKLRHLCHFLREG